MSSYQADIVIVGGGIAGLWTLARLRGLGYQAILLEAETLGCQQSGASQGIIHGGTKYALTGKLTHSAQSIQKMPQRWKDCLNGQGEIDLSAAKKLSDHQYLWSNKNIASRLTGFFASKVMSSRMKHLSSKDFSAPFSHPDFAGDLYQLDEPVLDIQSVIESIRQQFEAFIFQYQVTDIQPWVDGYKIETNTQDISIRAQKLILTAGSGNEKLLNSLNFQQPQMQRRPLYMPILKAKSSYLPMLYAHCLGASALPKMTITSYPLATDEIVWYLGGEIAEKGVSRSLDEQIKAAKQELKKLMPWMDFSHCQWSALAIDRAEPKMPDASRPIEPAVFKENNVITAWPVKLAMTPIMVDKIIAQLEAMSDESDDSRENTIVNNLPPAQTTKVRTTRLPWQKVEHWL